MKYIVVLGDGMADWKCDEIDGKTPLEFANTPNMDLIAERGRCGMLKTVSQGFDPGSDVANLGVLGYRAEECYTGRGPLEAVSMGIDLKPADLAYRCNLVNVTDGVMNDFSAGHISSAEGALLFKELNEKLPARARGYPGVSYRNLLVIGDGRGATTKPPHDITGEKIAEYVPKGGDEDILAECVAISREVFKDSPVNKKRIAEGKTPATQIWPWSGGYRPSMQTLMEQYPQVKTGAVISAVDLIQGIGKYAGLRIVKVPGATGLADTNYEGKAQAAIDALKQDDFVFVHVEATDEAGHDGDLELKLRAIGYLDQRLIKPIVEAIEQMDEPVCMAVLPDHPTPVELRIHVNEPVPFIIYYKGIEPDEVQRYDEVACAGGSYGLLRLQEFMQAFMSIE